MFVRNTPIKMHCIDSDLASEAFGTMKPSRWSDLVTQLQELEMIDLGAVDPDSLHTNEFMLLE